MREQMMKSTSHSRKKPINFRLTHQALMILALLEKKLHTSKTAVIEKALQFYADQKLKCDNPLMQYAGMLSDKESDDMLIVIQSDRKNKTLKTKL